MYVILFEAIPHPERVDEYFAWSKELFEALYQQPGFLGIDRAKSIYTEDKLLSISFWESEEAIDAWADHPRHREAQEAGKRGIFKFMRITRMQVLSSREVPILESPEETTAQAGTGA